MSQMLIDRYLPIFETTIVEHTVVDADVAATWAALTQLDLMRVQTPLVSAAMAARELPTRVAAWLDQDRPAPEPPPELTLGGDGPGLDGWLSLGQVTGREIAAIEG